MTSDAHDTYDIIFAGGGATACVTAGRLAATDPSLKIFILEAGPHTRDIHAHIQPGRYFGSLLRERDVFTHHEAMPNENVNNRAVVVSSGRCIGGGSSVNSMVYSRAAASDYDDWEAVYGNKGWGSNDLIPLLRNAETYQETAVNNTHGSDGPLKVSFAKKEVNIANQFLAVAAAYDTHRSSVEDMNDFSNCNKYARMARFIDANSGRRSDVPHYYIYNQERNTNLKVLDRQRVVRVVFEGNRAVGVEYTNDILGRRQNTVQPTIIARASRFVIISAGAFGSPAILERSGIGSPEILKRNGIETIVDLPGVGEHYMDHNLVAPPYYASEDANSMDTIFRGTEEKLQPYLHQWVENGDGLMAHNALDAGIKLRPTTDDLKEIGPSFHTRWNSYFRDALDKSVTVMNIFSAYAGMHPSALKPLRKYFSMGYFTTYPVSFGHVHITSGIDPYGKLNFVPGFLSDPGDLALLRWMYKKSREIARRMPCYRGELSVEHPAFSEDSEAIARRTDGPVEITAPDIRYTVDDDQAIENYLRQTVGTLWHSSGTCAMKSRSQAGVVDDRLNVYGTRGLKVADLSIIPSNVGANTYNTAVAIGEKAAVIIAEDLGTNDFSQT